MIGKTVTWTSQAGGHSKTKTGTVLAVIRAGNLPPARWDSGAQQYRFSTQTSIFYRPRSAVKFDVYDVTRQNRLLVEVPRLNKKGHETGSVDIYAPLLSVVLKQNPELGGDPHATPSEIPPVGSKVTLTVRLGDNLEGTIKGTIMNRDESFISFKRHGGRYATRILNIANIISCKVGWKP